VKAGMSQWSRIIMSSFKAIQESLDIKEKLLLLFGMLASLQKDAWAHNLFKKITHQAKSLY
jgi:hypothetical protein